MLYLTSEGGIAKAAASTKINPAITMMATLGTKPLPHVTINELTTVASAWTGAQFLNGSSLSGNALGLRIAAGAGVLGILALAAPLIWAAASAGVGLIALLILGALGVGIMQALPLLGQKWENKLLAARKAEARRNPIEHRTHCPGLCAESLQL